ncbi:HAMP domain-containing histidine kinase [Candidatus Nomurabacteria bacterium]|nr:MAG: HAMP domain-containing histidine kinase [Candidatus Nomurabacteria bacterium]
MKNILKQFEVSGMSSTPSNFKKAVLKLTVYYTLGVFAVILVFNLIVYSLFSNTLYKQYEEERENSSYEHEDDFEEGVESRVETTQGNLLGIFVVSDAIILLLTVLISYLLSKRTLAPLEIAYKKQARFVADAAHELRTPLAVMRAGGEVILRSDRKVSEYQKYIQENLGEVERLTNISNDLLILARSDNQNKKLLAKISLSDNLNAVINIMEVYAKSKNITLNSKIDGDIFINGKKDDITRLVMNLVKNAIDYNKIGGSVDIGLNKSHNTAHIIVKDNGIGIKKEALPYIFDRFYKADSARSEDSNSGSGLGLAIARDIVLSHGGEIRVESIFGEGTTFSIDLPCV